MDRPIYQKRRLNYNKCVYCRSAKKKCAPVDRMWPEQKCDRCNAMDLPCSENLRAGAAEISMERLTHTVQFTNSLSNDTDFQEFLDLSVRVASLRQLIKFVRSAQVVDTDLANLQPELYRSPPRLDLLKSHVHLEADNTVRDIEAFLHRCESLGNNFVTPSTSHLLLRLQSSLDQSDEVYETVPSHSVTIEHSRRLGDWGAALMMQEIILIRTIRNQNQDRIASELQTYLNIHREFVRRVRYSVIPPLHYLLLLTNDNWILEAAAASISLPQDEDPLGRSLLQTALDEIPSPDIQILLKWGSPVEVKDDFGRSALHIACMHSLPSAVNDLLEYEALVTALGPVGCQPLHLAVARGHKSMAELLLAKRSVDPNCADDFGMTPLSYATRGNHQQIVQLLLSQKNVAVNYMDKAGMTPLLYAAHNNNERLVRQLLLRDDANPDYPETDPPVLSHLAMCGHLSMAKLLFVRRNNDPAFIARVRRIPLLSPTENGYKEMVTVFLGDMNFVPRAGPLSYAARLGYHTVVELLLSFRYVDPDHTDRYGRTPLSYAAEGLFPRRHVVYEKVVSLLLAKSTVRPDAMDYNGKTPLMYAAERGHEAVVNLLLDTEMVSFYHVDKLGVTPLVYAERNGHHAVAKLLRDRWISRKWRIGTLAM